MHIDALRDDRAMDVHDYDYELPEELIAQHPLPHRADARLLVVDRGRDALDHRHVRDLPAILGEGDHLVLNNTQVVPARLVGRRAATGGRWQGLFLAYHQQAGESHVEGDAQPGCWQILGKTRGKLQPGERIVLEDRASQPEFDLELIARQEGGTWIARPTEPGSVWELLERVGRVPLPPYIRGGEMEDRDQRDYQTVYAERPGAVAAPTAGLHFTDTLLDQLRRQAVQLHQVTLHVGVGTFRPLNVERLEDHKMHEEWGEVSDETAGRLRQARERGERIIAIGTTVVRTLQSAADGEGTVAPWQGTTDLFIRPPFSGWAIDGLLTNFHLPRSTLLVLVRTFGGDELIRRAYREAIAERYRFYSYGDAMLIL